jgi:hypothetical protein
LEYLERMLEGNHEILTCKADVSVLRLLLASQPTDIKLGQYFHLHSVPPGRDRQRRLGMKNPYNISGVSGPLEPRWPPVTANIGTETEDGSIVWVKIGELIKEKT